jgi:hypothetical protein
VERELLAKRFLDLDDTSPETVIAKMTELFPGHKGLAGLYIIEMLTASRQ